MDLYFDAITSPSPLGVDAAHQYTWFTIDLFQSPADSHFGFFARAVIFFFIAENKIEGGGQELILLQIQLQNDNIFLIIRTYNLKSKLETVIES